MTFIVCAHAGAWNTDNAQDIQIEQLAVNNAVEKGIKENSVLDIATTTVCFLEEHPALDAGIGSILQLDGHARTDAAVATNNFLYSKKYAAVLQSEHIKNPCLLAKKLLEYGYHSILSGSQVLSFAKEEGFLESNLVTEAEYKNLLSQLTYLECSEKSLPPYKDLAKNKEALDAKKLSTVGAVAVDTTSQVLASVTSTGGLYFGYPGRVGDTGLFGHGIYCDNNIAVACTGEGDKMIQALTAFKVSLFFQQTNNIQQSLDLAVQELKRDYHGDCGIIGIDSNGNVGISKSTTFLATAIASR